jgi:1,2-beta-oligoglucan phosphorylase
MILKNRILTQKISSDGVTFSFLESGDIHDITYQDNQINLVKGNIVDGTLMNLYLRVMSNNGMRYVKLIGTNSPSSFELFESHAVYYGKFLNIEYQVFLTIQKFEWNFDVLLKADRPVEVDLFYGQDVGIAAKSSVLSSEPYTVQYIDYKSNIGKNGYILSARQNQGRAQYLQLGSHTKNIAYSTDGFQFFKMSYKETGVPGALNDLSLPSEIYQYEFSYMALQSDKILLNSNAQRVTFYGLYAPEDVEPSSLLFDSTPIHQDISWISKEYVIKEKNLLDASHVLSGRNLSSQEVDLLFHDMHHVEETNNTLLSFFSNHHHHIVLKEKELLVERPHGHLMIHGDIKHVSENVMATTNFMFGLFNSHLVLGNTSFNKFLGDLRNPLNLHKISGTRIYVKIEDTYQLLGLPSYYEIGATTSRWFYKLDQDVLIVDVIVDIDDNHQALRFYSESKKKYEVIVSSQILMGVNEYSYDIEYQRNGNDLIFDAPHDSMFYIKYPNLKYKYSSNQPFEIMSEKKAFGIEDQHGLLLMHYKDISDVQIDTLATFENEFRYFEPLEYSMCDLRGTLYFESFAFNFNLTHEKFQNELDKLTDITFWYTHNALTHYSSPHGLEQYNGAAWGTRDVCQGPIEFFSATQNYEIVREILIKVYQHQFIDNGDFPQWYMFDNYYQIQAHESHGDIIIWPLRSLAYYLKATNDFTILTEQIPFMSIEKNEFTEKYALMTHLNYQLNAIKNSFIPNTHLPRYGGGDWDDTLQPANHDLTNKMVSGWTVALLYEAIFELSVQLNDYDLEFAKELKALSDAIKHDYEKYMIVDDIPAGFVVFDQDNLTYLLHPRDKKSGLKYRLLPFTRSMISGIVHPKKITPYVNIINQHFKHPDGVRLMDTTVEYRSGKKTYFTRAETAANFGREIGLQYVHAHIRYIEAMAKIGHANDAYEGLFTINPILLQDTVKNAYYRQSNVYFSSSDAWFKDRYEAKRDFDKIRNGEILVKGGWRLYSSGPGIYINQLISNVLGIRIDNENLVIDPVLPKKLDGLILDYHYMNKKIQVIYHYGEGNVLLNGFEVSYQRLNQKYRDSGIWIEKKELINQEGPIQIDIFYK